MHTSTTPKGRKASLSANKNPSVAAPQQRIRRTTIEYTKVFNTVETLGELYIIRPFVNNLLHITLYTKPFELSSILYPLEIILSLWYNDYIKSFEGSK